MDISCGEGAHGVTRRVSHGRGWVLAIRSHGPALARIAAGCIPFHLPCMRPQRPCMRAAALRRLRAAPVGGVLGVAQAVVHGQHGQRKGRREQEVAAEVRHGRGQQPMHPAHQSRWVGCCVKPATCVVAVVAGGFTCACMHTVLRTCAHASFGLQGSKLHKNGRRASLLSDSNTCRCTHDRSACCCTSSCKSCGVSAGLAQRHATPCTRAACFAVLSAGPAACMHAAHLYGGMQ